MTQDEYAMQCRNKLQKWLDTPVEIDGVLILRRCTLTREQIQAITQAVKVMLS